MDKKDPVTIGAHVGSPHQSDLRVVDAAPRPRRVCAFVGGDCDLQTAVTLAFSNRGRTGGARGAFGLARKLRLT